MRDLWNRLESYLKKHAPAVLDSLNPPATVREIQEAERELGIRLPSDFTDSLLIHNGQGRDGAFVPNEFEEGGFFRASFGELAPLSQVVSTTFSMRAAMEEYWRPWTDDFEYDGPIRRDGNWSWIIFIDAGSGNQHALDLQPAEGGHVGQVVSILHDPSAFLFLAPSFRAWFEALVERYETGRYYFAEIDGELEATDRFEQQKRRMEDEDPPGDGILRFPG